MAHVFLTVEGNTAPAIEITLRRRRTRTPVDITGATARMIIFNPKTKTITNTGHQACSIVNEEGGVVAYNIESGDFPDPKVDYLTEVEVTYSSGKVEIWYDQITVDPRPKLESLVEA